MVKKYPASYQKYEKFVVLYSKLLSSLTSEYDFCYFSLGNPKRLYSVKGRRLGPERV